MRAINEHCLFQYNKRLLKIDSTPCILNLPSSPPPQHGADVTKKNRDGATPLDLVREGDQDVADLLRGNAALLDAAKKGNLARVQRLVSADNINCRDAQGRNSTPLHLAGKMVCKKV